MAATIEQWMRDAAKEYLETTNQDSEEILARIIASHAPSEVCAHSAIEWDKHMHNCFTCLQRGYDFQYRQRSRLLDRWPKSSGVPLPPEITSEAAAEPPLRQIWTLKSYTPQPTPVQVKEDK